MGQKSIWSATDYASSWTECDNYDYDSGLHTGLLYGGCVYDLC